MFGADILEVVAGRTSLKAIDVKMAMEKPRPEDPSDEIRMELEALIPLGRRDWVQGLFTYLTDCSSEDANRLLQGIRTAKERIERASSD